MCRLAVQDRVLPPLSTISHRNQKTLTRPNPLPRLFLHRLDIEATEEANRWVETSPSTWAASLKTVTKDWANKLYAPASSKGITFDRVVSCRAEHRFFFQGSFVAYTVLILALITLSFLPIQGVREAPGLRRDPQQWSICSH